MAVLYPAVVSALEGKDCREVMKSIAESSPIPEQRLSHIVAGMYRLLSEAIRIPTSSFKQEVSWLSTRIYCVQWNMVAQNPTSACVSIFITSHMLT